MQLVILFLIRSRLAHLAQIFNKTFHHFSINSEAFHGFHKIKLTANSNINVIVSLGVNTIPWDTVGDTAVTPGT